MRWQRVTRFVLGIEHFAIVVHSLPEVRVGIQLVLAPCWGGPEKRPEAARRHAHVRLQDPGQQRAIEHFARYIGSPKWARLTPPT